MPQETERPAIQYSCYFSRSRAGEQFVPEHAISYILSGTTVLNDGTETASFGEGGLYFCRRNQLLKYTKYPPDGGEYRSVSVYFPQDMLRAFSLEYNIQAIHSITAPTFKELDAPVLKQYMASLQAYESLILLPDSVPLLALKQKEAILLLLQCYPSLRDILFDFAAPGKIDLEAFMNRNFHFNVTIDRFAYLTGRSLAAFKRDFEKVYELSPSRWLLQRRLQEAYYLIRDKKQSASDVYLELGFEDLSHFSFAFKKAYGVAPSKVS